MRDVQDSRSDVDLALAVLIRAVLRCPDEDVRIPEVFSTLDYLDRQTGERAAAGQLRAALDLPDRWARFKQARDALNALKRAVVVR
jgi:hypothetical protein